MVFCREMLAEELDLSPEDLAKIDHDNSSTRSSTCDDNTLRCVRSDESTTFVSSPSGRSSDTTLDSSTEQLQSLIVAILKVSF